MRLLTPLAVFVIAIITTQARTSAEDTSRVQADQLKAVSLSNTTDGMNQPFAENGFDQFRHQPDIGAPGSPRFRLQAFSLQNAHVHNMAPTSSRYTDEVAAMCS